MNKVRHVLGISGSKDSAALVLSEDKYPTLDDDFYTCDTKCRWLKQSNLFEGAIIFRQITTLQAAFRDSPEPTPFDHLLKINGGFYHQFNSVGVHKKWS